MKASLETLARDIMAKDAPKPAAKKAEPEKSYPTAQTRAATRQISGHFAAEKDMDVKELLAEALNMVIERKGRPNRIAVTSGRRKKRDA